MISRRSFEKPQRDEARGSYSLPVPIPEPLTYWHETDKDYAVQCEYQLWRMAQRVSLAGIGKYVCPDEDILRRAYIRQDRDIPQDLDDDRAPPTLIFGMEL